MNWIVGFFLVGAFYLIFIRLRAAKKNKPKHLFPKKYRERLLTQQSGELLQEKAGVINQRLVSVLHRSMPKICLVEDGKVYGFSFQNSEPPALPHGEDCQCFYQPLKISLKSVFDKVDEDVQYPSDLGTLHFQEYKYYKYSLLALSSKEEEEKKMYQEFQQKLKLSPAFVQKVNQHLQDEHLKKDKALLIGNDE